MSSRVSWISLPDVFDMFTESRVKREGGSQQWFDLKTEFPQTTCLSCDMKIVLSNKSSVIERSIVFDWQNFIVSSIMFDWARQSNEWCSNYRTVRLDTPGIHNANSRLKLCIWNFRNNLDLHLQTQRKSLQDASFAVFFLKLLSQFRWTNTERRYTSHSICFCLATWRVE